VEKLNWLKIGIGFVLGMIALHVAFRRRSSEYRAFWRKLRREMGLQVRIDPRRRPLAPRAAAGEKAARPAEGQHMTRAEAGDVSLRKSSTEYPAFWRKLRQLNEDSRSDLIMERGRSFLAKLRRKNPVKIP
jgi:hypothetical protein